MVVLLSAVSTAVNKLTKTSNTLYLTLPEEPFFHFFDFGVLEKDSAWME